MKKFLHALAGAVAMTCIFGFLVSTLVAELFLAPTAIAAVKHTIVRCLWLLVPAMAAVGASGFALSAGRRGALVEGKMRRMRIVAINGLLILLPAAFYLDAKAAAGQFDGTFYIAQLAELIAGAVNFSLLALNMRDGLRLAGRLRRAAG